jgi:hypothetical protein
MSDNFLSNALRKGKELGWSVARGVPQMATGFIDILGMPLTATGLVKPEEVFGSTDYLTSKGLLPPKQEGLDNETTELVSSALSQSGAVKAGIGAIAALGMTKGAKKANEIFSKIPPPENAARTQIKGTVPTYEKAAKVLSDVDGEIIDFGAGLGEGAKAMENVLGRKVDTYEPFAQDWSPKYSQIDASDVPSDAYSGLTNLNVLNVVPREMRDQITTNIGRVLRQGGKGVITTRGKDVLGANGVPGPEPMSVITSRDTYQKGFTNPELQDYLKYMLGEKFEVNKLKLGPAGAVIEKKPGLSIMVPEGYDQISPATSALSSALRSADPAPVYSVKGVPIQKRTKSEQTKYDKAFAENDEFRRMESMRNGDTVIEDVHQFSDPRIIQYEELLGKRGIPIHGDRTAAGKILHRLNGIDIPGGVSLEGGPGYAHMHGDLGTGYGWASMQDAAKKKQQHFKNAAHDTDTDVMGIYTAMGMDGLNFSHMPAEAMVKMLREMPMNKSMMKKADDEIRHWSNSDKFVGLRSDAALDQLLGKNDFPMQGSGALRKALIKTLSKAEYQKAGAPNYFDMMNAMTDSGLGHDIPVGTSGYAVIKGKPSEQVIKSTDVPEQLRHQTYNTVIPGEYQGRMVEQIPDEIMFPSVFNRMRESGKKGLHRAFSIGNKDYQDFNEPWLEGVLNYLRQNERR